MFKTMKFKTKLANILNILMRIYNSILKFYKPLRRKQTTAGGVKMFKDLKIGTKIPGGFTIIIVILIVIAIVGYRGMSGVQDRVEKADDVNRIVKMIGEARQQEKNYILRKDDSYITSIDKSVNDILNQAKETKEKFNQKVNKDQMDAVTEAVEEYSTGFHNYVDIEERKVQTMTEMRAQARDALQQLEDLRVAGYPSSIQHSRFYHGKHRHNDHFGTQLHIF